MSASTNARCTLYGNTVPCETPVLPQTLASLECRNSYREDTTLLSRSRVRCNDNGQWEPEPMRCVPGPITINIYVNNTSVSLQTDKKSDSTLIEVFDDKVVLYINKERNTDPDIDVRFG